MDKDPTNKDDLRATALNDIENCVKEIFLKPSEEAFADLNLSIQTAISLGVTKESVLSRLLNSMPDLATREHVISQVAKKHNLSDREMDALMTPED